MTKEPSIEELQAAITSLEGTSKMLIRRDLDLQAAYENLKSLDTQKSEFIAIAAHQLRTPLTTIQWSLNALNKLDSSTLSLDQQEALEQASTSCSQMHQLVENLITLNKVEYGGLKLSCQVSRLETCIKSCIKSLAPRAHEHNITIDEDFDTNSIGVNVDVRLLAEAIKNILENAIKYSTAGQRITIRTSYTDTRAKICVLDSGIGVDEGSEEHIFKKFSRLERAERVDANGSGLGLYIARKIVEQHDGTITFAHNKPTGSIFTITLPCYTQSTT